MREGHGMDAGVRARTWAWWGVASVALFVVASLLPFPAVSEGSQNDPAQLQDALAGHGGEILIRNGVSWWAAAALVVFLVGLHRHLATHHDPGSLVPGVAQAGSMVTGAGLFIGYGMLAAIGGAVLSDVPAPTLASVYAVGDGLAYGTWTAIGLVCGAVALAGLRGRGVPRWLGYVSALFAVLFAGLAFFPFLSWFPGLLWVLAVSLGLRFGRLPEPAAESDQAGSETITG